MHGLAICAVCHRTFRCGRGGTLEKRPRGRVREYRLTPYPRASAGIPFSSFFIRVPARRWAAPSTASVVGCTHPSAEPKALAGHLDDRGVREKAVQDRRGGRHVAEERRMGRRATCRALIPERAANAGPYGASVLAIQRLAEPAIGPCRQPRGILGAWARISGPSPSSCWPS